MILAHYSPKELNDFIDKIGLPTEEEWPEVKTKSELIQLLNDIRTNNIELSWNKNHVVGLATPILKKGRSLRVSESIYQIYVSANQKKIIS